ncbi:hypothetical protein BS50DRAFT_39179 [Corynespora cassiicola Philippines]|uniref:Zn(2)-C6 fungal-type domain-containing protein n=1 Tax=Corynespora cassiicola Philippines TaxID=1448308 RepID=A0A2T2PCK7_CORCC|nr:hypothetical protein BS50DRAFT_39179 [Corynespora cassiicola Philippines]
MNIDLAPHPASSVSHSTGSPASPHTPTVNGNPAEQLLPPLLNKTPRKRSLSASDDTHHRKRKVTRACDTCKAKKAKCSGTQPCETCQRRGIQCLYEARCTWHLVL